MKADSSLKDRKFEFERVIMKIVFCFLFLFVGATRLPGQGIQLHKTINRNLLTSKDTVRNLPAFIPANFALCNDGFFCKQELKLEKKTHVPVKFRLGTLEQTNWLEGKLKYKPVN